MKCPFCEDRPIMELRRAEDEIELIVPQTHQLAKLALAGVNKSRGKWYECPKCGFAAIFRKRPGEP